MQLGTFCRLHKESRGVGVSFRQSRKLVVLLVKRLPFKATEKSCTLNKRHPGVL